MGGSHDAIFREVVGWGSALLLLPTFGLQTYKQWKNREEPVSGSMLWFFILALGGTAGQVAYSWMVRNWVYFSLNSVLVVNNAVGLGIALHRWRMRRTRARGGDPSGNRPDRPAGASDPPGDDPRSPRARWRVAPRPDDRRRGPSPAHGDEAADEEDEWVRAPDATVVTETTMRPGALPLHSGGHWAEVFVEWPPRPSPATAPGAARYDDRHASGHASPYEGGADAGPKSPGWPPPKAPRGDASSSSVATMGSGIKNGVGAGPREPGEVPGRAGGPDEERREGQGTKDPDCHGRGRIVLGRGWEGEGGARERHEGRPPSSSPSMRILLLVGAIALVCGVGAWGYSSLFGPGELDTEFD